MMYYSKPRCLIKQNNIRCLWTRVVRRGLLRNEKETSLRRRVRSFLCQNKSEAFPPLPWRLRRFSSLSHRLLSPSVPFLPSGVPRTASVDEENGIQRSARRQGLREAARFLRHAGSRRMMREPSMLVRETASEQLEERQSDWAYSKPVVFLDILWNLAFVAIAVAVLILSRGLHIACVCVEYRRRMCRRRRDMRHRSSSASSLSSSQHYVSLAQLEDTGNTRSSVPKDCRVSGWLEEKDMEESETMNLLTDFT